MIYNTINLTKAVKDSAGNVFNIDWVSNVGRSPFTNEVVTGPTSTIEFFYNDIISSIAGSGSKKFLIIAPDTLTRIHFSMVVLTGQNIQLQVFEGTTVSGNGNTITPLNRDRNDTTLATYSLFQDPTITADGNLIKVDTNIGQVSRFDDITHVNEIILKQNTIYEVSVNNGTSGTITVLTKFSLAEVN